MKVTGSTPVTPTSMELEARRGREKRFQAGFLLFDNGRTRKKYRLIKKKTEYVAPKRKLWRHDQARKGARWMPWHRKAKKDVVSCEKLGGVANTHRSQDVRMEQSVGGNAPTLPVE